MFGFGSYRVFNGNPVHAAALEAALSAGISVIDTSSNYMDGRSEVLVGRYISNNTNPDLRVITKLGYVQGTLYEQCVARETLDTGFPDIVKVGDGLWHCIHPEFLAETLQQSLDRLKTQSIHAVLLHNPEYYLQMAIKTGLLVQEARIELYKRIKLAFEFFEDCVGKGLIEAYGISSNTFVVESTDTDHVSLELCIQVAETIKTDNHFSCVQFPFNLLENEAALMKNQAKNSKTTLQVAHESNMFVMANRPLNAYINNELIRLATHKVDPPIVDIEAYAQEVEATIHALEIVEHEVVQHVIMHGNISAEEQPNVHEAFRVASALCSSWNTFQGLIHWQEVLQRFLIPRLTSVRQYLDRTTEPDELNDYISQVTALLDKLSNLYSANENLTLDDLRLALAKAFSLPPSSPLQHIALHALNNTQGVSCVLVGMRTPEYVHDAIQSAELPESTYTEQTWTDARAELERLSAEE